MTILASLHDLHTRMTEAGEVPRDGFSQTTISGEIVLHPDGRLAGIRSLAAVEGNRTILPRMDVPLVIASRTSGIAAQFMWDKTEYVLGVAAEMDDKKKPVLTETGDRIPVTGGRTELAHAAFVKDMTDRLGGTRDPGLAAILAFLEAWEPKAFARDGHDPSLLGGNLVFRIDGEDLYLHERPEVVDQLQDEDAVEGAATCLVTGDRGAIAVTHPPIKGVAGAQSSGAALMSFNRDAFCSYGRKQGANAPVSAAASRAISNVLNHLLRQNRPGPGRKAMTIGSMTLVYWAATPSRDAGNRIEDMTAWLLGGETDEGADADDETAKLSRLMDSLRSGRPDDVTFADGTRVHMLGLLPNAGRLSVRLWTDATLPVFIERFRAFHDDLEIVEGPPPAALNIRSVARETVAGREDKRINPMLPEALLRTIVDGKPYPRTLVQSVLTRIRLDQSETWKGRQVNRRVTPMRAAICKAYLARNMKEDVSVSLDPDNTSVAYLLGRAMRVHEDLQRSANPNTNRTAADRFMAPAMATPARVFAAMARANALHLSKLRRSDNRKLAGFYDRLLGDTLGRIDGAVPARLSTADQALFTLGYYHQKKARAVAKNADPVTENTKD